ncbi:MAG: type II toxin-antitoxin system HicB family antitoxin [Gammaproteobacteria bacterium]|nr:type II toxin-antitoxin system HicB family antitoxin [Gammaproteobacteria bacterium]
MIDLPYSLIIEATESPERYGFHSPDLDDFGGVGFSIEDCIYRARWGMREHVEQILERGLSAPPATTDPTITIRNLRRARAA